VQLGRAWCGFRSDRSERQELLRKLYTRDPADADGSISGTWTGHCKSYDGTEEHDVLQVDGTRQGLAVALTVEQTDASERAYAGYFDGPDRLRISIYDPPDRYTLLTFDRW
jgi:hypothetical protein